MNNKILRSSVDHEALEAEAATWIARKDNAELWSEADDRALLVWIAKSTAHRVAWLRLAQAWKRADQIKRLPSEVLKESESSKIESSLQPVLGARKISRLAVAGITYVFVLLLGGVFALKTTVNKSNEELFVTAVGARQQLTLEDGSHVMLNTRTRARASIDGSARKFWLDEGEAFFEIKHDPLHPFVIKAGRDRITVLGTKFSVRHDNGRTQVTVVEGRVALDQADVLQGVPKVITTLSRNDSAISIMGKTSVEKLTTDTAQKELSWREGLIVFDNKSLSDIAAEFNRYNRRQLIVSKDAADLVVSGKMDAHNIDGFVRLIHVGFGVLIRTDGDDIHLSMN